MAGQVDLYAQWCRGRVGTAVTTVLAIAFVGHLILGGSILVTIGTGLMLATNSLVAFTRLGNTSSSASSDEKNNPDVSC